MIKTILVIDDEPDLLRLVDYNLTKEGFLVLKAKSGEEGLSLARKHAPDLVLLDVMMPRMDGWDVCRRLRAEPKTQRIPVIMLTAKAQESDKVLGLGLGADDYITKPFGIQELIARIGAVLRRMETACEPGEVIRVGSLMMDAGRRRVTLGGKDVSLTTTEFNLLKALADRAGRVMTRDDLISLARGEDVVIVDRNIDVHVTALRRKLGDPGWIETVRGVGYRLRE